MKGTGAGPWVGLFGRVYASMLASALIAGALLIALIATTSPPRPSITAYDDLLAAVAAKVEGDTSLRIQSADRPRLPASEDGASRLLAMALARDLGVSRSDVRARVSIFGPPLRFGIWPEEEIAKGARPAYVAGDFVVERREPSGTWTRVDSGSTFARAAASRFGLLLLATALIVLVPAYLLAQRLTQPFVQFASAARRVGQDPMAPDLPIVGPEEVRVATLAVNDMQARLRRFVEDRTSMVTAIAHDLRTPLTRMSFIIEDAEEGVRERLARQIQEMQAMLTAVIAYLRSERPRHERAVVDLGSLVDAVCQNAAEVDDRVVCGPYEPVVVRGDAQALSSIVRNLVDNALKTSATRVDVSVAVADDEVVVRVEDDGPGLPEDMLDKVFEPFVRIDASRNRATGGVGLGLTLVRSAALAHGGRATLRNRDPHGLTAEVRLPMDPTSGRRSGHAWDVARRDPLSATPVPPHPAPVDPAQ